MRCANVMSCEEVKAGKCNGHLIISHQTCDGFKAVEADSCDGCIHKVGVLVSVACDNCCRNENRVDNYKFAGGE
jgi:hypothetical protein